MKSRICITAHFALGAMRGGSSGHCGGVERQTSMMAKWLAGRGHDVSLITWDEGQEDVVLIDGIKVIKACRQDAGIPWLRFFYPRWSSLVAAMRRADSDLYYHNCAEYVTGQVALWCRLNDRKFVYSVASEPECEPALPELQTVRERLLFRYGLKSADRIIVQTKGQQQMLRDGFGLESIHLNMPCTGPADEDFKPPAMNGCEFTVGWVGRLAPVKRLELLLDAAASLDDVKFEIAGKQDSSDRYMELLLNRAERLPNVFLRGHVARNEMPGFYGGLSVLCCTSVYEGMPNAYLEAWSHGLPIIATVDPDDLISTKKLGVYVSGSDELTAGIRRMKENRDEWKTMSQNARRHYRDHHAMEVSLSAFEKVFKDVLRRGNRF